jgi:hypothetical protein
MRGLTSDILMVCIPEKRATQARKVQWDEFSVFYGGRKATTLREVVHVRVKSHDTSSESSTARCNIRVTPGHRPRDRAGF